MRKKYKHIPGAILAAIAVVGISTMTTYLSLNFIYENYTVEKLYKETGETAPFGIEVSKQ